MKQKGQKSQSVGYSNKSSADKHKGFSSLKKSGLSIKVKPLQETFPISLKTQIADHQFDLFTGYNEFPAQQNYFSSFDPKEALAMKKRNRGRQMQKRRDLLLGQLQNQSLRNFQSPALQIQMPKQSELNRHKSTSPAKKIDAVVDPRGNENQLTPNYGQQKQNNLKTLRSHKSQRGNQKSQFTISSAAKNAEHESNSIISEEDSAFEDFSPRNNRRNKKRIEDNKNKQSTEYQKLKGPMANAKIEGKLSYKNNEPLDIGLPSPKDNNRQVRKEIKKNLTFKRSTTTEKNKGNMELSFPQKQKKTTRHRSKNMDEKKSRDSSLNIISDQNYDQISVNIGQYKQHKKFLTKNRDGSKNQVNHESGYESNSVVSVITGNKQNYNFGFKKSFEVEQQKMGVTSLSSHINEKYIAQSKENSSEIELQNARKFKRNDSKIINVYLQTPYKVNNSNQVKQNLYRAENNLKIHTNIRNKQRRMIDRKNSQESKKGRTMMINFNKQDFLGTDLLTSPNKNIQVDKSHEIQNTMLSQGGNNSPLHIAGDSMFNTTSTYKNKNEICNNKFLNAHQRKMIKDQQNRFEFTVKEAFYDQLNQKLDRKLELVNQQSNQIWKQNQLFNIYGPRDQNWFNPNNIVHQNIVSEMMQHNQDIVDSLTQTQLSPNNGSKFEEGFLKDGQKSGSQVIFKELSKVHPYLPENGRLRQRAIKEIEQCIMNSPPNKAATGNKKMNKNTYKYKPNLSPVQNDDNLENISDMIEKIKTMGFSKIQINSVIEKKENLDQAEKKLEQQLSLIKSGYNTTVNFFNDQNSASKENIYLMPDNYGIQDLRKSLELESSRKEKIMSKSIREEKQRISRSIQKKKLSTIDFTNPSPVRNKPSSKVNQRASENKDQIQFYFDNKIGMKRSIQRQEQLSHGKKTLKYPKQTSITINNNMIHSIPDEKSSTIRVKSKFKTERGNTKQNEKKKTNFVLNNIKNTVLPQILNQYNNGSEIKKIDKTVLISDNDKDSIHRNKNIDDGNALSIVTDPLSLPNFPEQQRHDTNQHNIIAQSRSRVEHQRLSYNSGILSYSSAEMIANFPISYTSRAFNEKSKQQPMQATSKKNPGYKKSSTQNEKTSSNSKKLKPTFDGTRAQKMRSGLDDSPPSTAKVVQNDKVATLTYAERREMKMNEAYNNPNQKQTQPSGANFNTIRLINKFTPLERNKPVIDQNNNEAKKTSQSRRNGSNERSVKKSVGNHRQFYNEKFINSEQTAILKSCFNQKKELQKMLSGLHQAKHQPKRTTQASSGLPQISNPSNFAPTQ